MESIVPREAEAARLRRRQVNGIKETVREMSTRLAFLNRLVGSRLELRDVDLNCLDLISRHGPLSPSALARLAGLHPATTTGVLDRLQRGGWVTRERDAGAADRRAVSVHALRDRGGEVFLLYAGMNSSLDEICEGYTDEELAVIADFLRRTAGAGRDAAAELAGD
jgi:DNA-binding MarR family transcriptional regulator